MVEDDFWSEPIDDFSNIKALANQEKTPTVNMADAAQSLRLATNRDTIPASQPLLIPKTSPSAPIIYEDIWGDDVEKPSVAETSFSSYQKVFADIEPIREWIEDEELLSEQNDETLFLSKNSNEIPVPPIASPFAAHENTINLTELEDFNTLSAFDNKLEQDLLMDDLELLDIDAALAELNEEELPFSKAEKQTGGVVIGHGNVPGWMGSYGLFYIDWEYGAEAEQEALKRLGYAELEISEATRAFVIQAARAARLPRSQERELTTKLDYTRLLLTQLPKCYDPEKDPYAEKRTTLMAEIADIERMLVYKMQWVAVKKAVHFMGRGIDLDDLIQFGMLGVIAGVKHYDVNRNARLLVVVNWWVFQSLNRAVSEFARFVRVPVYIAETLVQIKKQHNALQMSLGRLPTLKELADVVQVPVERLKELLRLNEKIISLEWCKLAEDAHEGYSFQPFTDASAVSEDTLNEGMDKLDLKQYVEVMLRLLTMRERQVIKLRYGLDDDEDERTLEEIGKILHITRERVRQIEERAFKKIRNNYLLTRKIRNDYFLTKKKVIKVQDSPQKNEENTLKAVSRHEPKQRKTAEDSKLLPKVNDAKSQRSIIEVEGHTFQQTVTRHGFILRRVPD